MAKPIQFKTKSGPFDVVATDAAKQVASLIAPAKGAARKPPVIDWYHTFIAEMPIIWTVDTAYQTEERANRKSKLVENWDPQKVGVLIVNLREDGVLYCIDGWHRTRAALAVGMRTLPVLLHIGLTQAEEAEIFAKQQLDMIPISPKEHFTASLVQGIPEYVAADGIIRAHGYGYDGTLGDAYLFSAYSALKTIMTSKKVDPADCLEWMFDLLCNSGWAGQTGNCTNAWVEGMFTTYRDLATNCLADFDNRRVSLDEATVRLTSAMNQMGPRYMRDIAANRYAGFEHRAQCKQVLRDLAAGNETVTSLVERCGSWEDVMVETDNHDEEDDD